MPLSGIYDFGQLQARFPPRNVAGMTHLGVLQLPHEDEFMPVIARFYGIIIKMYFSQSEHGKDTQN
jgi:hypothetical protein